ncbi:MAG: hypothetical protein K6F00_10690 [Lachnospiraceae bacterium]|nr:hypothetical protein [Lachnospiraceae bacterium]
MQKCNKCRITIRGEKRSCPLCGGRIEGEAENPAFPVLERKAVTTSVFIKMCLFIAVVSEITLGAITVLNMDLFFATGIAAVSILFVLADIFISAYYRGNVIKLVTLQTYLIMFAVYDIDRHFSGRRWSLQYVIPFLFIILMLVTVIIGKSEGLLVRDYVIYIIVDVVLGSLQMIHVINGVNDFPIPAVISAGFLLIMAAYITIFKFNDLKNASMKYLNM